MLKKFSFVFILLIGLTAGQTKQAINDQEEDNFTIDNPMSVRPIWPSTLPKTSIRGRKIRDSLSTTSLDNALSNKLNCAPDALKEALKKAQSELGNVSIVSGYRPSEYNKRVGGARNSFHTRCQAADVRINGIAPSRVAKYFSNLESIGGIGTYSRHSFVHIDIGPKRSWHY